MSLVASQEIVAAAMISTQAYLELLESRASQAPQFNLDHLKEQHIPAHIEGQLYHRYSARLPAGLKIRPDAHALFTPKGNGATPIPARILDYNASTGMARLGFLGKIEGDAGRLRIEHRQALRRWLVWLERCGTDAAGLDDISRPDMDAEQALDRTRREGDTITERQMDAVRAMLATPVSFVCGPSGSGKTSVVLARAARALLAAGRRVLITAWRDDAVDQALTALIHDGVPEEQILRVGVPTAPFLRAYPACCEIHAGGQGAGRAAGQLRRLQAELTATSRVAELKETVERERAELAALNAELTAKERAFREASEAVRRLDLKSRGLHNEFFRAQGKLTGERRKRSELHVPEIEREKKIIQTECDFITKTIKAIHQELNEMSSLSSLLGGGKRKEFQDQLADNEKRLAALKAKIADLDQRQDARQDSYKDLTGHIYNDETVSGSMDNKLNKMRDKLSDLRPQLQKTESDWMDCRARAKELTESLRRDMETLDAFARDHGIADVAAAAARHKTLAAEAAKAESQIAGAETTPGNRAIIGMTLDAFIGFAARDLADVDWVFVDEAHCAPVVKMIPLLTLRRPIALLGEARHMPPYCASEDDPIVRAWWAKPSPFLEEAFLTGQDFEALAAAEEPRYELTRVAALTQSFTIGHAQAELLARHIYGEALEGGSPGQRPNWLRHCEPYGDASLPPGVNESEAEEAVAVVVHLLRQSGSPDSPLSLAILTPGEAQAEFIRVKLGHRDSRLPLLIDVLAAHRAVGLEWDHVVFSATSTRRLGAAAVPPERLCSAKVEGRSLLHTVLTRARRQTIILLDRTDWVNNDPPCLLTELARTGKFFDMAES